MHLLKLRYNILNLFFPMTTLKMDYSRVNSSHLFSLLGLFYNLTDFQTKVFFCFWIN